MIDFEPKLSRLINDNVDRLVDSLSVIPPFDPTVAPIVLRRRRRRLSRFRFPRAS